MENSTASMDDGRPVPEDCIGLEDAFRSYMDLAEPGWADLGKKPDREAWCRHDEITARGELSFRSALHNGELTALIRDPDSGERFRLPAEGWRGENFIPGFVKDWVGPLNRGMDDEIEPGPNTVIRGRRQRVFFVAKHFRAWLQEKSGKPASKNLQKRQAVRGAIESIGLADLRSQPQKVREATIIQHVQDTAGLSVSARYVRNILREMG